MSKNLFELTDGNTTRQGYFKKVTTADGLNIISLAEGIAGNNKNDLKEFIDIAVKYLVLVIPETNQEQDIKSIDELDAVFDNPFLAIKIAEEFEKYIAPYLESLKLATNNLYSPLFRELEACYKQFKGVTSSSSSKINYPCHPIVTTLILNNYGDYDRVMNMSFESAVYTYITVAISNIALEKEINKGY